MGCDQSEFAELLGVSQAIISQWEKARYLPSNMAIMAIGNLDAHGREWWYKRAGQLNSQIETLRNDLHAFQRSHSSDIAPPDALRISLYHDPVSCGPGREISPHEIDEEIWTPRAWFPSGAKMAAFHATGDSMSPMIEPGYTVFVDRGQRNPRQLVGWMVLAGDGSDVALKWLRQDGKEYVLVPQHVSLSNPVKILLEENVASIWGKVIRWLGEPPKPQKLR